MIVDPASAPVSGETGFRTLHLSVAGGLTQFGAYLDTLDPDTCVSWPVGVPDAHCLRNDGTEPATLFITGSRFAEGACHYPDIDLHYSRRNGLRTFARKDGTPYPGWPKETQK